MSILPKLLRGFRRANAKELRKVVQKRNLSSTYPFSDHIHTKEKDAKQRPPNNLLRRRSQIGRKGRKERKGKGKEKAKGQCR